MRRLPLTALLLCLALPSPALSMPATGTVEVFFSPNGGATAAIVRQIDSAKRSIVVQAYSFTSRPIVKALIAAKHRGVAVEVLIDSRAAGERYSEAEYLVHNGVPVFIDAEHSIAHSKTMVLDSRVIITGSFNFTTAAETRNAENVLVLEGNAALATEYLSNYRKHRQHSAPYASR